MNQMFSRVMQGMALAWAITLTALIPAGAVQAQDAPGMRVSVRGEITGIAGDVMHVQVNSGENVIINLTPGTVVRAVTLANIEDIKPGSYIGSAAVPQSDGTLKALEVHVFPHRWPAPATAIGPLTWSRAAA